MTNASGHAHKGQSGRTARLSRPPSRRSDRKPDSRELTPPCSNPPGGALSVRQVALWAGWPFRPSGRLRESRAAAPAAGAASAPAACAEAPGALVGRGGWNPRLGARHGGGGGGGDARVPGGAETAAERAADPGVRPGWECGLLGTVPSSLFCYSASLRLPKKDGFLTSPLLWLRALLIPRSRVPSPPVPPRPSRHHLGRLRNAASAPQRTCCSRTYLLTRAPGSRRTGEFGERRGKTPAAVPCVSTKPCRECLSASRNGPRCSISAEARASCFVNKVVVFPPRQTVLCRETDTVLKNVCVVSDQQRLRTCWSSFFYS